MSRLTAGETDKLIDDLVETRYPYQVAAILREIDHDDDLAVVVAAALARTLADGEGRGKVAAKAELRLKLGL